ncbi:MAG: molybdopterin molybdotransferase MoeA [Actinomycetaceae bacterium]|nr:molybdopterin molybdotransferase MoeA [Actinomycetaceae bacterium]
MTALSIEQHREKIRAILNSPAPHIFPLSAARGLYTAESIPALLPVPPFTNSAMDGFAIRHSDILALPASLPVGGDIPAGSASSRALGAGEALRIMTGAPLPVGADTVVKVEDTDHSGRGAAPALVTIYAIPEKGANIRHEGEALPVGAEVLPARQRLTPAALSALVATGHSEVAAYRRPRVAVLSTGEELVSGAELSPGQIPDSNSILLAGLLEQAGAEVAAVQRSSDSVEAFRQAVETLADADCDLVLTSGGISAGAFEVVRQALAPSVEFYHVAQQPGGPQGVGTVRAGGREIPAICLPGNPVSVFVSFHLYVAPAVQVIAGAPEYLFPPTQSARSLSQWNSPKGKTQFVPMGISADSSHPLTVECVHPLGARSHLVTSLPFAQALAVIPPEVTHISAGDSVDIITLP